MRTPFSFVASTGCRGIIVIFCCFCVACGRTDSPSEKPIEPPAPETPKALQDKSSVMEEVRLSKRADEDLVEELYQEQAKKDQGLAELEDRLEKLKDHHSDSIKSFIRYNDKNDSYYSSAISHIGTIKDSVLRRKIMQLITASDTTYRKLTAGHRGLLADIDMKRASISDLHTMLKLARTAVIIEQYQKGNLPGTGPLRHLLKEYEQAEQKMEGMIKN